jgi:hypothetical protein
MFLRPLLLTCLAAYSVPLYGQESVCQLFKDLPAADGRQLILTGDLILSRDSPALGAADCENQYRSPLSGTTGLYKVWPTAIHLAPSPAAPPDQVKQLQDAVAKADALRRGGKTVSASATFSGRLQVAPAGDLPAELIFDSIENLVVDTLPDAATLPVIPICDLFQHLADSRGKRIAVRAEGVGTDEGYWLVGRCKGAFYTDGYRWPVSLTYGSTPELAQALKSTKPPKGYESLKGRYNVVHMATHVGRLRMKDQYAAVCRPGGDYLAFGFGHLGGAAAELVVEAILDEELTPNRETEEEEPEEKPCSPPNFESLCASAKNLMEAVSRNCVGRTAEFLAKEGIDSKGGTESAALRMAIALGNEAIAKLLLDAGAPVNPATKLLWSPLGEAGHRGRIGIMRLLLKKGADVDDLDRRGATYLASYGFFNTRVMKLLLEAHANPNARDEGETALMHASFYGYEDAVKLLIQYHADVNLVDHKGRTALMHAASGEYVDAIPLLLAAGANPNARDSQGKTALDIAKDSKHRIAEELLSSLRQRHR